MDVAEVEHPPLVRRRQQAARVEQPFRFVEVRQRFQLFGDRVEASEIFFSHDRSFRQKARENKAAIGRGALPARWRVSSLRTRMLFSSRFCVCLAVGLLGLFGAGCEKKDPLAERRFRLLVEENARLVRVVEVIDPTLTMAPFTGTTPGAAAIQQITAENDQLREVVTRHERDQALAANKSQREVVERQVEKIRGLEFKQPVDYAVLNRKEIKQTISQKLADVFSEEEFRHMTDAMAAIGLLPPKYPLREKYIDLLGEQVAAFYDQHQHKLVMYEDATLDNAQNRVVLAHELTHALQDQHFGLKALPLEIKTNDDRAAAASALVEGDATLVMSEFMLNNLSRQMVKDNLVASFTQNMKQLETAPRYLREMLVFPYLRGQEFCAALFGNGGYEAVSKAYANPPSSTAQILHPQKYMATPREDPIVIEWPATTVKGEKPIADNVVGELGLRILFAEWLDAATGERAAAGWRGDRYLYFAGGEALVWKTVWATAEDAAEFFAAEKQLLEKRHQPTNARSEERRFEADGPRILRLVQTDAHEVLLIDTAQPEWAAALAELR